MTSSSTSSSPDSDLATGSAREKKRRAPQVGLSTLLLATACFAVWWSYFSNRRAAEVLDKRIASMRFLSRELIVEDRAHIAAVKQDALAYQQQIWHVFLPNDSLELHLATRNVSSRFDEGLAPPKDEKSVRLPNGEHKVELTQRPDGEQWLLEVLIDQEPVLSLRESKDWKVTSSYSSGGVAARQENVPVGQRLVLLRSQFADQNGIINSNNEYNGILLWIE